VLSDLPYNLNQTKNVTLNCEDLVSGLDTSCAICISPPCVWQHMTAHYEQGSHSGTCTIQVDPTMPEGIFMVIARVSDLANNTNITTPQTVIVDRTPPGISNISIPEVNENEQFTISARVTDATGVSTVRIRIGQSTYTMKSGGNDTYAYTTSLAAGEYAILILATDMGGHTTSISRMVFVSRTTGWSKAMTLTPAHDIHNVRAAFQGGLHYVWEESVSGTPQIFYTFVTSGGSMPLAPLQVTQSIYPARDPSVSIDSTGIVHVAWIDGRDNNPEVYYTHSVTGGFSAPMRMTNNPHQSLNATILGDSSIVILWLDDRSGTPSLFFTRVSNNSQEKQLVPGPILSYAASVINGVIWIVWQDATSGIAHLI
jgi:hypothetical protein